MMSLAKKLKKNYKLAILSNTIEDHNVVNEGRGIFNHFEEVLLSNEVGFQKPQKFFGAVIIGNTDRKHHKFINKKIL